MLVMQPPAEHEHHLLIMILSDHCWERARQCYTRLLRSRQTSVLNSAMFYLN